MVKHEEFFITHNGHQVFNQYWIPKDSKAIIILVHGMGEHSSRYKDYVIPELLAKHFAVYAYDNYGHGKTVGKRGHCPSYDALMNLVDTIYHKVVELTPDLPIFLYGHSMGGNLVVNYTLRHKPKINGLIATSPLLRLAFQPPAWKMSMGKLFKKILPSITLPSGLETAHISRDEKEVQKYNDDPLVHDKISPMFSVPVFDAGQWAVEHASGLSGPVFLAHGTADAITDFTATQQLANGAEQAELTLFKNGYHELHNDLEKEKLMMILMNWILQKIE